MALKLVTGPAAEPVTVEEARAHLRVDSTDEDAWINAAIVAVRQRAEAFLNRALVTQTWELWLDEWPGRVLELPLPPLVSVTHVKWYDRDGVEATVSSGDYVVDAVGTPGRVALKSASAWPAGELREVNGVVVRFVAGYGASGRQVPAEIKWGMLLVIGDRYENRENTTQAGALLAIPTPAEMLWTPWRVKRF